MKTIIKKLKEFFWNWIEAEVYDFLSKIQN